MIICLLLVFYSGCDSQKDFKPEHIQGKIEFNGKLEKPLASSNQASAKLKNKRSHYRKWLIKYHA